MLKTRTRLLMASGFVIMFLLGWIVGPIIIGPIIIGPIGGMLGWKPDLYPHDLTVEMQSAGAATAIVVSVQVSNRGTNEAKVFGVRFSLTPTSPVVTYDKSMLGPLSPGNSVTLYWCPGLTIKYPPGQYTVKVIVDIYDQVTESDETNNSIQINFQNLG